MQSTRLCYFDNLKAILIVLVVLGHLLDVTVISNHEMARAAFVFIYSFHMPLFIFVAGLFVNPRKLNREKTLHRIVYFIILGFLAKLLEMIVPVCFGGEPHFSLLSDSGLPWYMFAMAFYCALAYALRSINSTVMLAFSLVLGTFVGYDSTIGDFLYLSRIIVFSPFFWVGVMLSPTDVESVTKKPVFRTIGAAAILLFAAICILHTPEVYAYRGLFTGRNSFQAVTAIENCSCLNRLITYFVSGATCIGILAITPHRSIPIVSNMGKRTLQIYLLHYPVIQILGCTGVLSHVVSLPNPGWLLVFPLAIAISVTLTAPVLTKPLNWLNMVIPKME